VLLSSKGGVTEYFIEDFERTGHERREQTRRG
jgi:hypothetical protein